MRVLFCCTAAEGHFRPLVPLAEEAVSQGHEVGFASAASFRGRVGAAGFELLAAGIDRDELELRYAPYLKQLSMIEPAQRRPYAFAWRFGAIDAPAKVEELLARADGWQPDLIVHEPCDLAAPLVAEALGVPSVQQGFGRRVPALCFEHAAEHLDAVWAELGVNPVPLCGAFRGDYIDICPPSLRPVAVDDGVRVFEMRIASAVTTTAVPSWGEGSPNGRTIYLTLGTMFNDLSVFEVLLEGLSRVDCTVVATVGRDKDPTLLASVPPNAIVERFIPQDEVLPHIQAVVCHGGSGSMLAALAHGLPILMLPQAADQFENALACKEAGAALVLMPGEVSSDAIQSAATTLLDDPTYTESARRVAVEISKMQSPAAVLALLMERLQARPLS